MPMRKLFTFLLLLTYCSFAYAGVPDEEFETAKRQLAQAKTTLLKSATLAAGATGAVGLVGYALRRARKMPINFSVMAARLPEPNSLSSKSAKHLIAEKRKIEKEAQTLMRLGEMIKKYYPPQPVARRASGVLQESRRTAWEREILGKVFQQRYLAFEEKVHSYNINYKEFIKTGKISTIEKVALQSVPAKTISKTVAKRAVKMAPLVGLMAYLSIDQVSAQERAAAERLIQNPAILFSLTEEQEQQIKKALLCANST